MYMQFSCNTNYNRFFVIQYQIKDKLPPQKSSKKAIMQERDCPFHGTHCKPVLTMPIFFWLLLIQADEFKSPHLVQIPSTRMSAL